MPSPACGNASSNYVEYRPNACDCLSTVAAFQLNDTIMQNQSMKEEDIQLYRASLHWRHSDVGRHDGSCSALVTVTGTSPEHHQHSVDKYCTSSSVSSGSLVSGSR